MKPQEPTAEQKKAFEEELNSLHALTFQKRELIILYNILTKIDMKYGDSLVIGPIIKKIEPIVVVESNITKRAVEAEQNHQANIILGTKKEVN